MRLQATTILFGVGLAALLCAGTARAQSDESPQHWALEIKFSPYVPHVDSSPGLGGAKTPFSDLFGDPGDPKGALPSRGLLSQIELDYQFLQRFGSLGVGVSAGYHRRTAPAPLYFGKDPVFACTIGANGDGPRTYTLPKGFELPNGAPATAGNCLSPDENSFNVVPLSVMLVYRFDLLDRRFRVPIIPYLKVGLNYTFWWSGTSNDAVAHVRFDAAGKPMDNGPAVSGGTAGWVLHPGLALNLGAVDRQAAAVMDRELGLNRVTAFVELNFSRIDNFGAGGATVNLSDTIFNAGLAFEF